MQFVGLLKDCRSKLLKCVKQQSIKLVPFNSGLRIDMGRPIGRLQGWGNYSTVTASGHEISEGIGKMTLAENLACLLEESSSLNARRPKSRMELKRSLELRIKKRVKEQFRNGIYQDVMERVIANPETLKDAYNCIKLNSNVEKTVNNDNICFESMAGELSSGSFDVSANTFTVSTKGITKEVLVLPNIKLKVVQEAMRIVLEVVYRPYFSKISHGCRSGRGQATALKYVKKEITNPDWWFALCVYKKMNTSILAKLISVMKDKLEDPSLYNIIQSMFDAQVLNVEFGGYPKGHGVPQEGVLTPILLNIYLDNFDSEFYRLSMKYEALERSFNNPCGSHSELRSWFRRQLKGVEPVDMDEDTGPKFRCCRFMDEIIFAVSGSEHIARSFRSEIINYLRNSLQLDVDNQTELVPSQGPQGIRFLGIIIKRSSRESPALRVVHKLKEKVQLFASQKQESWDRGTVRIGKKWLSHGLKKVKESEIRHLADNNSTLTGISCFRKAGMETDHWYKLLLKIWMGDIQAKSAKSEEFILSKYVAEPAIPQELRDSYYEFQKRAKEYVCSEAANTLSLLPNTRSSCGPVTITEIIAPVNNIKKRLARYGLTTSAGHARAAYPLVLQEDDQIIHWFSGIICRWLKWYSECDNFSEVKLLISDQVRKSCIRTLAAKYRIHETEIEKKFDMELSRIPCTEEIEQEAENERSEFDNDEALTYGISYSGSCLLSLARIVSQSRPCICFIVGCSDASPNIYTLHVMERQKFPGWKTGFSSCIHPSLNKRRVGLCKQHVKDLYLGHISLQSIDFGAWK